MYKYKTIIYSLGFYVIFINLLYSINFHSFFHVLFMKQVFAVYLVYFSHYITAGDQWLTRKMWTCFNFLCKKQNKNHNCTLRYIYIYIYICSHTPILHLNSLYSFFDSSFLKIEYFVCQLKLSFYRIISKALLKKWLLI